MKKLVKSFLKKEEGGTSIEFGMIALGFIFLCAAIVETGRVVWTMNAVDHSIEHATRYAIIHQDATNSEIEGRIQDDLSGYFVRLSGLSVNVTPISLSGIDFIEISGSYTYTPVFGEIIPGSWSTIEFDIASRRPVYN